MKAAVMTLDAFRASARAVDDLAAALPNDIWEGAGRIYAGSLVIEKGASAAHCLTIGNSSVESNDLAAMELDLYEYAVSEGFIDADVVQA